METSLLLNNLQESLLIKSDKKIEIMNSNFIDTFNHLLAQNFHKFRNENIVQLTNHSLKTKIKNWYFELTGV